MIKHANGRNVSDSMNVKVRSHPGATTECLKDYVKPIARIRPKRAKVLVIQTRTNNLPDDMNSTRNVKMFEQSICKNLWNWRQPRNSICFLRYCKSEGFVFIKNLKLYSSFPSNQFLIKGFREPFWLDINRNSGGLLFYIKSSLLATILSNYREPSNLKLFLLNWI